LIEIFMDLFCPHCSRRVTVPDGNAGQVTSCPLCAKQFMTPSLAPAPTAPPPPPAPSLPQTVDTYGMGPPPPAPPPAPQIAPPPKKPAAAPEPPPPPPPLPPGDYTRSYVCQLKGNWLAFVPTACLVLIFFLTFFSWHYTGPILPPPPAPAQPAQALPFWTLAISTEQGQGQFLAYMILMFPCGLLAVAAMLFDMGVIPAQPQLAPIMTWKNLIVGVFLTFAFLMLCIDYTIQHFAPAGNPIALPEKVAIRLHFLAVVASFLMFWLQWRKLSNKPLPKCEFRW
jgi:hypothetical protein